VTKVIFAFKFGTAFIDEKIFSMFDSVP